MSANSAWRAVPALFFGILSVLSGCNVLFIMSGISVCNPDSALAAALDLQWALWKASSGAAALAFAYLLAPFAEAGAKPCQPIWLPACVTQFRINVSRKITCDTKAPFYQTFRLDEKSPFVALSLALQPRLFLLNLVLSFRARRV